MPRPRSSLTSIPRGGGGASKVLGDTYTLDPTTHNFPWNVTGPMFNTHHAMFMEQYTEMQRLDVHEKAAWMLRSLLEE